MTKLLTLDELLAQWDSPHGHPYKGRLIDLDAWRANPEEPGCMCAQGQVLHYVGGMDIAELSALKQSEADRETAKLLGISRAHAVLLRFVNDRQDGAPSIVLTHPEKVVGDQAPVLLALWRHFDRITHKDWVAAWAAARATVGSAAWVAAEDAALDAARAAARGAAGAAVWAAALDAAVDAAWDAAGAAALDAARAAAVDAALDAALDAAWASAEVQGAALMRERGQPFFFLPLFGFADPESVMAADGLNRA